MDRGGFRERVPLPGDLTRSALIRASFCEGTYPCPVPSRLVSWRRPRRSPCCRPRRTLPWARELAHLPIEARPRGLRFATCRAWTPQDADRPRNVQGRPVPMRGRRVLAWREALGLETGQGRSQRRVVRRPAGAPCAIVHPSSCTNRWCQRHSRTRLSTRVVPPAAQCCTWCASHRRAVHPGKRHRWSRARSARRIAGGIVRVLRPTSSTEPSAACRITTVAASQASRRDVSAETYRPAGSSSAA
jgi:hypothetical protein